MFVWWHDEQVIAASPGKPVSAAFEQLLPILKFLSTEAGQAGVVLDHSFASPEEPAVAPNGHVVPAFTEHLAPPMIVSADQPLSESEMIAEIGINARGKALEIAQAVIRGECCQAPLFVGQRNVIEVKPRIQRRQPQKQYE